MIFSEAMSEELIVWPEKAIFFTQRLLSLSLLMLIQSVVAPCLMVDGTLRLWLALLLALKYTVAPESWMSPRSAVSWIRLITRGGERQVVSLEPLFFELHKITLVAGGGRERHFMDQ